MIDWLIPRMSAQVTPTSDIGWGGGSRSVKTRAGVNVDEEVALTYEAVFAATRVLTEGIAVPPLTCYERVSQTDRQIADIDVSWLLKFAVNDRIPANVFREGRVMHQVNWGNAFAEIVRDNMGRITELWPIHPSRVTPSNDPDYDYVVRLNNGHGLGMKARDLLHIPGAASDDGIWGRGVIGYGRETIGLGIGTERSAQGFFGSGGHPKGVIEIPGMNDRQKRAAFREEWNEIHGDTDSGPTVAIIAPGTKYTPISLTNEANQLIQTRQVNKSNIATLYGIPAYKINAEGKETAGTIEQKAIEFVVYSLLPWAKKIEEQCNFKLLAASEQRRYYFEHNFTALLRGDQAARFTAYRIAFSIGVMTINEIRRLENMPSIGPAGDQYFVPANMTTAERAMNGDFGNGGGLGSDTTGTPADNPANTPVNNAVATQLLGQGTKAQRQETAQQLKDLERGLESRPEEWRAVARQVLHDAIKGLMVRESNAVRQAAKSNEFDAKMREFYAAQKSHTIESLNAACAALRLAGVVKDRADLAEWLHKQSTSEASAAYDSDSREAFNTRISAWPTDRTERLVNEIMEAA